MSGRREEISPVGLRGGEKQREEKRERKRRRKRERKRRRKRERKIQQLLPLIFGVSIVRVHRAKS